jgi:hypothetical protein
MHRRKVLVRLTLPALYTIEKEQVKFADGKTAVDLELQGLVRDVLFPPPSAYVCGESNSERSP